MNQQAKKGSIVVDGSLDLLPVSVPSDVDTSRAEARGVYDSPPSRAFSVDVAWTLAARVVMVVSSFGAGVIIARWLGAAGLGVYAVLNLIVNNTLQFGSAGLIAANVYFISQDRRHLAPAAVNALIFALGAGSMLALCVTGLAAAQPALLGDTPLQLVGIAALSIPFQLVILLGANIYLPVGRLDRCNFLDVIGQSFILLNAVLAVMLLNAGLWTLISLNTMASIGISILVVWLFYRYIADRGERISWRPRPHLFMRMIRYGIKFHVLIIATTLLMRADLLIVNFYRGAAESGVYAVASQGALFLVLLPTVIGTLLFPRVTQAQEVRGEMTCVVARHTAFLMAIICLVSIPASFILPFLYGASFADATVQLLLLLPGVYLISIELVLVQYFNAGGLPAIIPFFWVVTLAASVVLNLTLVPTYGARGAAVVSTISYTMIFALIACYFRLKTGNSFSSMMCLSRVELRRLFAAKRRGLAPGSQK